MVLVFGDDSNTLSLVKVVWFPVSDEARDQLISSLAVVVFVVQISSVGSGWSHYGS